MVVVRATRCGDGAILDADNSNARAAVGGGVDAGEGEGGVDVEVDGGGEWIDRIQYTSEHNRPRLRRFEG